MKQKRLASENNTKPTEPSKSERFLLQRIEIGVLVFNEYLEKTKGQKDQKLTILEETKASTAPKEEPPFQVAQFNGILPKKSKEAVAGAYVSGVERGQVGVQRGIRQLLGLGGLFQQINEMTSVLNLLDQKVYEQNRPKCKTE